jgi:hypothetical protein
VAEALIRQCRDLGGILWSASRSGFELVPNFKLPFQPTHLPPRSYIKVGQKEGARLVCGGKRWTGGPGGKGYYVEPTIFADVTDDMTIAREEIFGPVMCVLKYSTVAEVR